MRIIPIVNSFSKGSLIKKTSPTGFESNNNLNAKRTYTGNASYDLAYASMFDEAIARDLKLMGLI